MFLMFIDAINFSDSAKGTLIIGCIVLSGGALPFCFSSNYLGHPLSVADLFLLRSSSDVCFHSSITNLAISPSCFPAPQHCTAFYPRTLGSPSWRQPCTQQSCFFQASSTVYKDSSLSKPCSSYTVPHCTDLFDMLFIVF